MERIERKKRQILLVEDEGLIASDIQRRLERLGYAVPAIAETGEEAIQYAYSGAFDLILMDVRLKGQLDGIATAQALNDLTQFPIVYMTAYSDQATIDRAKQTNPLGYVTKPIVDANLRSVVEIALHKHEADESVRASELWLWNILWTMSDGVIALDSDFTITFMNPVAMQFTGFTTEAAHGRPLTDVVSLLDTTTLENISDSLFLFANAEHGNFILRSRSGMQSRVEVIFSENRLDGHLLGSTLFIRKLEGATAGPLVC